jgi:hypothetical protein
VFVFPDKWKKNDRWEKKLVTMIKYYDLFSEEISDMFIIQEITDLTEVTRS